MLFRFSKIQHITGCPRKSVNWDTFSCPIIYPSQLSIVMTRVPAAYFYLGVCAKKNITRHAAAVARKTQPSSHASLFSLSGRKRKPTPARIKASPNNSPPGGNLNAIIILPKMMRKALASIENVPLFLNMAYFFE